MKKLHIHTPMAVATLTVWLALTTGMHWWGTSADQQSLQASVAYRIQVPWALAALFALAVAILTDRHGATAMLALPKFKSLYLVAPPLLFSMLMLVFAWASGWPAFGAVLIIAGNSALVAVSEELMFRAILLHGLMQRYAIWPSVLISSALFGVAHAVNGLGAGDFNSALIQAAAAFLQGIAYSAIRLRTASVWPMTVVHGFWDFAVVTSLLSTAQTGEASIVPYAAFVAVVPMSFYGFFLLRPNQMHLIRPYGDKLHEYDLQDRH